MTGRERNEAAFSRDGAAQLPVVICYENVFIRDHWPQLTSCPWWYLQSPDAERQEQWMRQVAGNSQAVRLPKEFRFDSDEVEIFRRGNEVVLREKLRGSAHIFDLLAQLPDELQAPAELPQQERDFSGML